MTESEDGASMSSAALTGYFSTVVFVPDEFRAEGINLGVVLLCPDLRRIEFRLSRKFRRARRILGGDQKLDSRRLTVMIAGLEEQLKENHGEILSASDLRKFANLFRNRLQLSDPRSCLVEDIAKDVDALFTRLVTAQSQPKTAPKGMTSQQLRAEFRHRLEKRGLYSLLEHDVKIPARYKPGQYEFAHGYRNGTYHIIHEEGFAVSDPDDNCERAFALATEIQDAREHQDADFTVIGSFANDQPEVRRTVSLLFSDKRIKLQTSEEIGKVVDQVTKDLRGHEPPPT
jgi:Protein of unknown function (DUF3037)